jgi:5-methylcytosine-specific restriction protein A
MPDRPYRICAYPRCGARTRERYCSAHKALAAREYNQTRTNRKHYDRHWVAVRNAYIARHPLCERCEAAGRLVPAEHVHHIVALGDGGSNADENLQALCRPCHSSIHLSETNRRRDS